MTTRQKVGTGVLVAVVVLVLSWVMGLKAAFAQVPTSDPGYTESTGCQLQNEARTCGESRIVDGDQVWFAPHSGVEWNHQTICCAEDLADHNPEAYAKESFQGARPQDVEISVRLTIKPGVTVSTPYEQYVVKPTGFDWAGSPELFNCGDGSYLVAYYFYGVTSAASNWLAAFGQAMNDWHDTQTNHFVFGMQFDKNTFTQLHELCGGQYSWVVYHWNHPGGPGGTPFRCTGKGTGITQGNHGDDDGDLGKSAADSVGVKPMSWTGVKVLMK